MIVSKSLRSFAAFCLYVTHHEHEKNGYEMKFTASGVSLVVYSTGSLV